MYSREELVSEAILVALSKSKNQSKKLRASTVGVIVDGVKELDLNKVITQLAKACPQWFVSSVGYPPLRKRKGLTIGDSVETAVKWRNDANQCAGKIVVFLKHEAPKTRSLEKFARVTDREISTLLIESAIEKLASNEQELEFWNALKETSTDFPLSMLESFVTEVANATDKKKNERIPASLWTLGLVRDSEIVSRNKKAADRLRKNRLAIEEICQLSEQSRQRMALVISELSGKQRKTFELTFQRIMDFFKRNDRSSLKELDLDTIEILIKSGRPIPKNSEVIDPEPDGSFQAVKPLRGKGLNAGIAELIVSQDSDAIEELAEFGDQIQAIFENPDEADDEVLLHEQPVVAPIDHTHIEFSESLTCCCAATSWGGFFTTECATIKEAFQRFDTTAFCPHDPSIDSGAGKSLKELFKAFDQSLNTNGEFQKTFDHLEKARAKLVDYVPILATFPFVPLASNPVVKRHVKAYLKSYEELVALYHAKEADLYRKTPEANRLAIAELLRLDVIHIHSENEWKAMLTPLHPFYLWRYVEVLKTVDPTGRKLSEDERMTMCKAMQDIPQVLHFLVSSPVAEPYGFKPLPLAGSIQQLPTFENDTNRYLGTDGTEFITEAMLLWLGHSPYSRRQMRIAVIDPPVLNDVVMQLIDFLDENVETNLVADIFRTRKGNEPAQLRAVGIPRQEYRLTELQSAGRLSLRIHEKVKITELLAELQQSPVHICFAFDQGSYECYNSPRAENLIVSPLVVTHQYEYDPTLERGTISPSVDTDQDGLFYDYHFLIRRIQDLGPNTIPRLQTGQPPNVKVLKSVIVNEQAQWLVCADRDLSAYLLGEDSQEVMRLIQKRVGQRELGVWARMSDRTLQAVFKTLERFPINDPDEQRLNSIFHQFWHVAANEWPAMLKAGSQLENSSAQTAMKGALGTIFAAAWYVDRYPGALVAALDSDLAKQWLVGRESLKKRADLVGFRVTNGGVIVEPIEVKAHRDDGEAKITKDSSGKWRLSGKAFEQLDEMLQTLRPIFGGIDSQPLFTNARREALKYQLHRECFRDIHKHTQMQQWYEVLTSAFTLPTPGISVTIQGLVVSVRFEELLEASPRIVTDSNRLDLSCVEIGAREIQRLLTGGPHDDDFGEDDENDFPDAPVPLGASLQTGSDRERKPGNDKRTNPKVKSSKKENQRQDELEELARSFRRACGSFSIKADCEVEEAIVGPNVIRFYVKLGRGQRIGRLRDALEDIGREMSRSKLVVTSIHNSDQIALDIPRDDRTPVLIQSVVDEIPPVTSIEQLPIPIGVTPEGEDIVRDLSKMPHMLVAGTTGAGKTVFLYGLIASLLKTHPDSASLKILLSSSKREDFGMFKGVKHFEDKGVVADAARTIELFKERVQQEIADRSEILEANDCRDIVAFNRQYENPIPPFVVIIDELADLSDQLGTNRKARNEFYTSIRQVAQAGRSRGVHLVLCTQRPSAQLLPTDIRSLMNLSIAFRMKKREDSQMIIEEPGADQLQMHGDLLMKDEHGVQRALGYLTDTVFLKQIISRCN